MSKDFYPLPAFFFGISIDDNEGIDSRFQEVTGLEAEMEMEEIAVGGNNHHKFRLPVRTIYRNVVLRRGMIREGSDLHQWIERILLNPANLDEPLELKPLDIKLLSATDGGDVLKNWHLEGAYPVKWSLPKLHSQENTLAVESIEFAFKYLALDQGG